MIDKIIETHNDPIADVVRFCASDKVPTNIFNVLTDNCPAKYAREVTKTSSDIIFNTFGKQLEEKYPRLSNDIKQEWVFDKVMEAGSYLRIASVRKTRPKDIDTLLKAVIPFGLVLEVNNHQIGKYSGLINFKRNVKEVFDDALIRRHSLSMGIVDRLIETVGSVDDSTWILHNPLWKDTLNKLDKGFFILKTFLHAAVLSHTITDDVCEQILEVDRETILSDTDMFIHLKEDENTSAKDIRKFMSRVEHYTTDVPVNRLALMTFSRSQEDFTDAHKQSFGKRFEGLESSTLPDNLDLDEWKFLRSLGEECSAEVSIYSEESPFSHTEFLINNHLRALYNSPYSQMCKDNGISIPEMFPKALTHIKVALTDRVYSSIVKRRFLSLHGNDIDLSHMYIKDRSYILLVIEDPEHQMRGLSLFNEALTFHMTTLKTTFFEREWFILEYFQERWNALNLFKPNKMDKSWKAFFRDSENRYRVRQFLFKLLESLYLEKDEEFKFQFDMTRFEFFNVIETMATMMSQEAHQEDLIDFLDNIPNLKQMVNITEMDQAIWIAPYHCIA